MHRRRLLEMLARYQRRFPDESAVVDRIRRLVEGHPDCFERTCRPGHITGSAWVLSSDGAHCLLLHHKKLGRWLQPGGHADGDPNALAVALREAEEESGISGLLPVGDAALPTPIDLDVHLIPERRTGDGELVESAHEHHDIRWLLVAPEGTQPVVSDESHAVRWCTAAEVMELTDEESVLRMLGKSGMRRE
ncbi:MAG: NUDIX hydrolase [Planctomycetota bacterium]